MGGYSAKNYTEQGGDVTHIGGKLVIEEGAEVEGFDGGGGSYTLPVASAETLGGVKAAAKTDESVKVAADEQGNLYVKAFPQIAHQGDASSAEDIVEKYNALMDALETAGLMATE